MMGYEGGDLTTVICCLCQWSDRRAEPACVQDVGGGRSGPTVQVSDESALEVCIHDDALYKSTFFTFFLLRQPTDE